MLYIDDYEYHVGNHLWRGRFEGSASGVHPGVTGGRAYGYSAWLDGQFIGSYLGAAYPDTGKLTLSFGNATVNFNSTNILLVLQDNSGHDETSEALNPRGINNATLISSSPKKFTSWKVTGTAGKPDTGLYAERLGWHLPGFDDSEWSPANLSMAYSISSPSLLRAVALASLTSQRSCLFFRTLPLLCSAIENILASASQLCLEYSIRSSLLHTSAETLRRLQRVAEGYNRLHLHTQRVTPL